MFSEDALRASAGIGIARSPDDGENPIERIHLADAAMYVAKKTPGNTYIAPCQSSLPGAMPHVAKNA